MSRNFGSILLVMMSVLVAVTADAASGSKPSGQQQQKEASAVVEEFFKYHFGHDMAFNCRNIEDRKQWLSQRLVKALLAECGKPVNPDEAPDIEGDPFTDSEEYPNNFKVEGAEIRGSGYEVTVKLVWPSEERRVRIVLIRSGKTWKIDDVRYEGSGSLNGLVREAARETTEPKGK